MILVVHLRSKTNDLIEAVLAKFYIFIVQNNKNKHDKEFHFYIHNCICNA